MRYVVLSGDRILALLGFGAAAWKTAPRDQWIGWNADQRKRNLHLVVNNARFLILPWVQSRNLASKILSAVPVPKPSTKFCGHSLHPGSEAFAEYLSIKRE